MKKTPRTCVTPAGTFRYGVHRPAFTVANLRPEDKLAVLGQLPDGTPVDNAVNFPAGAVREEAADWIYEVPNPFPFRGATFIARSWAEAKVDHPERIALPGPPVVSMHQTLKIWLGPDLNHGQRTSLFADLPHPVRMALAANSTDPEDLIVLADQACHLLFDRSSGRPIGLRYRQDREGRVEPDIHDHAIFEVLVNNPHLPDDFKQAMVLRPGVQGASEVVGEWREGESHVFEYLRRNSYIPWGHHAVNLADDAIRYRIDDLSALDLAGLRHLYYQRSFCRLAEGLNLAGPEPRRMISPEELETLRRKVVKALAKAAPEGLPFDRTLWGWNFGFDCAANGYRMHASHQMIHQQFALLPASLTASHSGPHPEGEEVMQPYGCGDLIHDFITEYAFQTGSSFFNDYHAAITGNTRLDGRTDRESSLIVYSDGIVILFVPKAQTSQWELQLMPVRPVGNILEADLETRQSLDRGMLIAMQTLTGLGARMITTIEYPKRFGAKTDQRLLYSFLPKLPYAPGAFSEAQLRFVCGHYPEDFARSCRNKLTVYRRETTD